MPAALKDILSCGDPTSACTSNIARHPEVVVTVRALHVRASAWLSLLRSAELARYGEAETDYETS